MKLTIEQINKLKEYGFITQVDSSSDILSHSIDTVELGKIWRYINQTDRTDIIEDWLNDSPAPGPASEYLTFDILSDGKIYWVTMVDTQQSYDPTDYCKTIQYSKDDGETWSSITSSDMASQEPAYIEVSTGDKILFKGNNSSYALINDSVESTTLFGLPTDDEGPALDGASFNISGNIMSLIGGDNFEDLTNLTDPCTFSYLFGWTKTVDASGLILPATTLAERCYAGMFSGCTSLTTAPELPATTLAEYCYNGMFSGCTSLTTAPELPATTLAEGCYGWMFSGCTSLTTAPELPATTLAEGCYGWMFMDCTSLTVAPELPAITLAEGCYNSMFGRCTSLTTAPELPATTLVQNCYKFMFQKCTSLNYIKCSAINVTDFESAGNYVWYWTDQVADYGTFVKAASADGWPTGTSGIPSGWTRQ